MPIWMRKFHILSINKYNKERNEEQEKISNRHKNKSNEVMGPNIKPSSTYNFKK